MKLNKEIYQRGEIVVASRLSQEYYDYTTGTEALALNRISEALFDIMSSPNGPLNDVEMRLKVTVPIGKEPYANKITQWPLIEVFGFNRLYEDINKFEGCMQIIARDILDKIGSDNDKAEANIIIGNSLYIFH